MATYNCSNGECIEIANVSCRATQADIGCGCGGQDRRCCIGPTGVTGPAGATGATGAQSAQPVQLNHKYMHNSENAVFMRLFNTLSTIKQFL